MLGISTDLMLELTPDDARADDQIGDEHPWGFAKMVFRYIL